MKDNILVIDDNEDMLGFLSDILTDRYLVYMAIDAIAAQELLKSKTVDLIISDIMMPGMDGFELCKLVKSSAEYSHIPIILLTSKNTYTAQIDGLKVGADAYIKKPFQVEFLQLQIANLLLNREQIKRYFSAVSADAMPVLLPSKVDEEFLVKLNHYVDINVKHFEIDINELAGYMNMSRPTLYRKIRSLLSLSPKELINKARVKKAANLIAANQYTLQQISLMVGYRSPSVFGKKFKTHFKISPSEYLNTLKMQS
jgi:DNA-binding response OmpR family regulator